MRKIKAKTKISVVVSIALLISFLFIFLSPKLVKSQGYCGDGICDPDIGEDPYTCPQDCGPPPSGYCGDGICDPTIGEDPYTCPQDCGPPPTTSSPEISSCTSITSIGEYYLTQDISSSELKCIDIQAYNVTLDCRGHIIKGVNASDSAGIYVYGFSNIKIINCIISDWGVGIHLERSSSSILSNITVTSNYDGIYIIHSGSNILSNITVTSNSHYGIFLYYANDNIINGSVIQSNGASGVGLLESYTNMFYNNLFNNTNNLYFEGTIYTNYWNTTLQPGTNIWNSSLGYIGGNLWTNPSNTGYSDSCTDANLDGFCDDPYYLTSDGSNIDYLPLAKYVGQNAPAPPPAPPYTEVSSCMQITQPGEYRLVNDLQLGSYPYCLDVFSNDVIIDCQGYKIQDYTGIHQYPDGINIRQNVTNVTVKNCDIRGFAGEAGVFLRGNNSIIRIYNTSVIDGKIGVIGDGNDIILDNISTNNVQNPLWFNPANNLKILNSKISGTSGFMINGTNVEIAYNEFRYTNVGVTNNLYLDASSFHDNVVYAIND
ncbi:MAG: right-handed parallel beta-helix repeat-containing protein, partial [archaeon YNP-WB-040]|nr:right-handed parallel beta-helix repeat-containing protein [Candidatus Culexarchaeum yellowstonense]